jgi:CubicO group peptidase (beta-lactamase class C family)
MIQEVFAPLGMPSISFEPLGATGGPSGHRDGRVADKLSDTNPRMFAPAGGISMSLPDWGRFCIDHMQGEHGRGRLLRTDTYRLLHKPQDAKGFSAFGWGYLPSVFGRRGPALFHAGSDGNWTAVVMLFCQTGNGVLVASNAFQSMRGDRAANETMRAIVPLIAEAEPVAAK